MTGRQPLAGRPLGVLDQVASRLAVAPKRLAFKQGDDFASWRVAFKRKILDLLGPFPEPVPPRLETVDREIIDDFEADGIAPFEQRTIVYDTEPHGSCIAYLLVPADASASDPRPGILVAHGHGAGRRAMVGLDKSTWDPGKPVPNVEATALHLAGRGHVVLAPDWRGFGDRSLDPAFCRPGRDPCNVSALSLGYFGCSLLALNVWDAMRSVDVLRSLPCVDPARIGMAGKSYGGTMTAYTTALDDRISCAVVSGYLSTLNDALSMRGLGNTCGAQHLHGLLEWGDIPDVLGLIAPRPLLIEAGTRDACFAFDDATRAFESLARIYRASGHPERLQRDVADAGHDVIFNELPRFFQRHLGR